MFLSFLMCVHKDQPFIDKAVRSMIEQSFDGDYEIIIVANDCSESFYRKLQCYRDLSDRIKLHRTSIGQLAFNLNYGINEARGEYIVRMDADDVCLPDRLTNTLQAIEKNGYPDLLAALAQSINESDEVIGKPGRPRSSYEVHKLLRFKNPIVHPATAIKRDSLLKVRGYLGGINCEDMDLWLRMDRLGMKMLIGDFVAIQYRINQFQVKGSRIAYADGVGLLLREGLYRSSMGHLLGAVLAFMKFMLFVIIKKIK
tara:strand:+ start:1436 stop:2203 length:768 start_codon:yes stop_codon:yes gene_type:complete